MLEIRVDDTHVVRQLGMASPEGADYRRLRHEYWVKEMHWSEDDGNGEETDSFDNESVHFGFFEGTNLVACGRFVPAQDGVIPLLKVFPKVQQLIDSKGPNRCGEVSRVISSENFRSDSGLQASIWLYKAMHHWATVHGYVWWFMEIEKWLFDVFVEYGFALEIVGEAVFYKGYNDHPDQYTYPVVLDLLGSLDNLKKDNPNTYQFYCDL